MKLFTVGALRPATDNARLSAANALVQRTLAQHGLALPPEQGDAVQAPKMPRLDEMLARCTGPLSKASAPPETLQEGANFKQETFSCKAGSRSFRAYIPASAVNGVTGVIVMLHGCTQTPEDFAKGTGMNALAELHRFVVVYPAQSRGDNAQSCWNWFSRGDQQRGRGEPAILAGIAAQVCAEHSVARDRTFIAGLSAGAAMAVILGETYPDVFAAVGAHSGLPFGAARDVASAFAAMAGTAIDAPRSVQTGNRMRTIVFHGTADTTVHPSNGDSIARRALDTGSDQSIETTEQGKLTDRDFQRVISSAPDGTSILEHWTVKDLGHAWSGGQPAGSYTDPKGPDASAEMIRFFFNTPDKDY